MCSYWNGISIWVAVCRVSDAVPLAMTQDSTMSVDSPRDSRYMPLSAGWD